MGNREVAQLTEKGEMSSWKMCVCVRLELENDQADGFASLVELGRGTVVWRQEELVCCTGTTIESTAADVTFLIISHVDG